MPLDSELRPPLALGLVGGGQRSLAILRLLEAAHMRRLNARVVAVADPDPQAEGVVEARKRGIWTTQRDQDLCELPELNLIVELTGRPGVLEALVGCKPASVGIVDHTASLLFHDIASFEDELDKKTEEMDLERSLARTLTEAASEGVMVLDGDYRILRMNHAACRWADLSPENARGRFCFQVLHGALTPCQSPETPCPMRETLASGRPAHCIHEFRDTHGEPHYCDVTTYPLNGGDGKNPQVLELFRDITEQMASRVESRTEAIKKDLSKLVREDKLIALGKLVASVAHEINNPIGSIINFTKLVLRCLREAPPDQAELERWERWLTLSVDEAERCRDIVQNLLSFSRQQSMKPKVLDLLELVDQIVRLTRHRMEIGNVELSCCLPDEPLEVWADATQIQQCLTNLVFNALEAMPDGGQLTIRAGRGEQNDVYVEVIDTGTGIAPEVLPQIFEPFFSTKNEVNGVGLGLSMVYGILSEHHGHIEANSCVGQGTTFLMSLPQASRGGGPPHSQEEAR